MLSLSAVLLVGLGGMLGTILRYLLAYGAGLLLHHNNHWATWGINVLGSLCIGYLLGLADRIDSPLSPELRLLLATGVCGGFTTFSTFSAEALSLLQAGTYLEASAYILLSVLLALAATYLGLQLAQA